MRNGGFPIREGEIIMTGKELLQQVEQQKKESHCFIKWWRKENDFVDIELMDMFCDSVKEDEQFGGFELLDMEQLWRIVEKQCQGRVRREVQNWNEIIVWERMDKTGAKRSIQCFFAPEFLAQVFDVETRGNYIE